MNGTGGHGGTIWESASRPLFVRSVWLEMAAPSAYDRPIQRQRHFILDYREENVIESPPQTCQMGLQRVQNKRRRRHGRHRKITTKAAVRESVLDDLEYVRGYEDETSAADNDLLIGSAKAHLHQTPAPIQYKPGTIITTGKLSGRRRSLVATTTKSVTQAVDSETRESLSRRSSFQDFQSTFVTPSLNPDEKLAERVLNWLDLAGKMENVCPEEDKLHNLGQHKKPIDPLIMNNGNLPVSQKPLPPPPLLTINRRFSNGRKRLNSNRANIFNNTGNNLSHYSCNHQRSDPMKHITIIFNKEGIPVRLNRPARNIDLCTLASSAATTRRLAGALASARLYKSATDYSVNPIAATKSNNATKKTGNNTARKHQTPRKPPLSNSQNEPDNNCGNNAGTTNRIAHYTPRSSGMHDAKKQLHIFMPSLPKKGLLAASLISGGGSCIAGDDEASALSVSLTELCKL